MTTKRKEIILNDKDFDGDTVRFTTLLGGGLVVSCKEAEVDVAQHAVIILDEEEVGKLRAFFSEGV